MEQQNEINGSGGNDDRADDHKDDTEEEEGELTFSQVLEVSVEVRADRRHVLDEFIVDHSASLLTAVKFSQTVCGDANRGLCDVPRDRVGTLGFLLRDTLARFVFDLPQEAKKKARKISDSQLRDMRCNYYENISNFPSKGDGDSDKDNTDKEDTDKDDTEENEENKEEDAKEHDTVATLKAELKKQEEDYAARLKKQEEDYAARLKRQEEDTAVRLKKQEEDTAARLKKQEEDYAARLKRQEEDHAAQLSRQKEDADTDLKKQAQDAAARLKKQEEDADAKLKGRMVVEEDLNKEIMALREESRAPDSDSSRQAISEPSVREQKLMDKNDEMLSMIAKLQADLKAAQDGISTRCSKGAEGMAETDGSDDDESQIDDSSNDSLCPAAEEAENSIHHIDIPDDDVDEPRDSPRSQSIVAADDLLLSCRTRQAGDGAEAAAAADEGDTSLDNDDLRERRRKEDVNSNTCMPAKRHDSQIEEWQKGVSEFVGSLKTARRDLRTGARPSRPCNLHAYEFPAPLELISLRVCEWAQGNQPLDYVFDIARDMLDFFECNQDVCEKAEGQSKKANQRIPRGYDLGSMMNVLNESIDAVAAQNTDPMVMEAMSLIWDIEKKQKQSQIDLLTGQEKQEALKKLAAEEKRRISPSPRYQKTALKKLTDKIGLHLPERSLLNVVLHLVAVIVAINNKDLGMIAEFGDAKKDKADPGRRMVDRAKIETAFKEFCPGEDMNKSKASVLVHAIARALADDNLDDNRKHCGMEAMFVIFDDRLANDKELWVKVDAFSLSGGEPSERKYFSDGTRYAPRRRYCALNYALILFLGKQYGELIAATERLECDEGEDFKLAFLRTSINTLFHNMMKKSVKDDLFDIATFKTHGTFDDSPCFGAMKALLDQSTERKEVGGGFRATKTILNSLDGDEDSIDSAVSLVRRIAREQGGG